ncbi:MAG: HAMP domain-containing histidine kinase [Akkermansiaceae bacterium]|nr:HAMP domain-containing histidine kinase [Akkermansiaceae bacterium]
MNKRFRSSLLLKALAWLVLHLVVLALVFSGFVRWQLGLGLDSLISGSAGERLRDFGEEVLEKMQELPPDGWDAAIATIAARRNVDAGILVPERAGQFPRSIPPNILKRAVAALPPAPEIGMGERRGAPPWSRRGGMMDGAGPPEGRGPPGGMGPPGLRPGQLEEQPAAPVSRQDEGQLQPLPRPRPVFLMRGEAGDGYWAGVHLQFGGAGEPVHHQLLLIRADRLDGSGMFFELKPWLWGGLAVLALSLAFWTPFMLGITRYLRRLTDATDGIAAGNFQVSLPPRGHDELGALGHAIQTMAARLDHLISGQKRFLGDAAHELCAPLARLRTGLGILEQKLGESSPAQLAAIEAEAAELATLVEEILAFSRARTRPVRTAPILLYELAGQTVVREGAAGGVRLDIPPDLEVVADPGLLGRALGNILRNAAIHAGPEAKVVITTTTTPAAVVITVTDDGPGVAPDELPRLFEPFYRPDLSRTRDTGGSGLGLAIVRTAIESCGGTVSAFIPSSGGFGIRIHLPHDTSLSPF